VSFFYPLSAVSVTISPTGVVQAPPPARPAGAAQCPLVQWYRPVQDRYVCPAQPGCFQRHVGLLALSNKGLKARSQQNTAPKHTVSYAIQETGFHVVRPF
jgi:hypothetical protein